MMISLLGPRGTLTPLLDKYYRHKVCIAITHPTVQNICLVSNAQMTELYATFIFSLQGELVTY